jgi:hypothetical protein
MKFIHKYRGETYFTPQFGLFLLFAITALFVAGSIKARTITRDSVVNASATQTPEPTIVPSPIPSQTPTPTPSPTPTPDLDTPAGYIRYKFGKDASKAFLLLQGNGSPNSCAENRNLDPNAVNDNTWWGGVGRDVGIFQINDVFHPVKALNLDHDWKANVDYAKRMFDRDGGTFSKRWTCGGWYKSLGYDI